MDSAPLVLVCGTRRESLAGAVIFVGVGCSAVGFVVMGSGVGVVIISSSLMEVGMFRNWEKRVVALIVLFAVGFMVL